MHGTFPRRRLVRRDDSWTFNETEALRSYWPDLEVLRRLLPHRTESAVRKMANTLGLVSEKEQHIWTCPEDRALRKMAAEGVSRKEIAVALNLKVRQVANRMNYCRINLARKPPVLAGDPLVDAVRRRLFDMRISIADFDRSLGGRNVFRQNKPKSANLIAKAVKALGGRLTIEWPEE